MPGYHHDASLGENGPAALCPRCGDHGKKKKKEGPVGLAREATRGRGSQTCGGFGGNGERESCSKVFIMLMPLMALGRGKGGGGVGFDYGEKERMQRG
jgi:hypothetical protein